MITSAANDMAFIFNVSLWPFALIALAIIFIMVGQIFRWPLGVIFTITSIFIGLAFGCGFIKSAQPSMLFFWDSLSRAAIQLMLIALLVVVAMIFAKPAKYHQKVSWLLLLMISSFGGMTTLVSHNWMLFFIGIQCLSLPLYGLIAFNTGEKLAILASTRYLVLSFIAMSFLLFGIVLLYASTKTMDLYQQGVYLAQLVKPSGLMGLGFAFVLVGLSFKASLFPFHIWAPEVYQGTSLFVVSYLLVIVKGVVIFFLVRCFSFLFGSNADSVTLIISLMAILSMWIGNGLMLFEKNFLRLMAYLSIAHLGYLMIPVLANSTMGLTAIFLDLTAFGLAILLLLASVKILNPSSLSIDHFRGLMKRSPLVGFSIVLAFISVIGFPLTAGFVGKYAIFASGIDKQLWPLVSHMLLSSLLGLYALAKIVISTFAKIDDQQSPLITINGPAKTGLMLLGSLLLISLGIIPDFWVSWAHSQAYNFKESKVSSVVQMEVPAQHLASSSNSF